MPPKDDEKWHSNSATVDEKYYRSQPEDEQAFKEEESRSRPTGARVHSGDASQSSRGSSSTSRSRSCVRDRRPRRSSKTEGRGSERKDEKPWFKKKTVWATIASVATVASLLPGLIAANASVDSASASARSAKASKRSARAVETGLEASFRSARASEKSAQAAVRSAKAGERSAEAVETGLKASFRSARAGEKSANAGERNAVAAEKAAFKDERDGKKIKQKNLEWQPAALDFEGSTRAQKGSVAGKNNLGRRPLVAASVYGENIRTQCGATLGGASRARGSNKEQPVSDCKTRIA